ncbi:MAG: hypothetical protein ACOH2M_09820 [Cypionkella sp.]
MLAKRLAALVAAAAIPVLLAYSGATTWLGAHPWWSVSIAWIGAPIGLALAMPAVAIGLRRPPVIAAAATVLVLAGLSAHFGKAEFAASFAENGLAGRFWYFGWIGVMAALTLMLALAFLPGRPRAGR